MSAYVLLFLGSVFSGGVFVAAKYALVAIPPFTVAFGRFALASGLLWLWVRQAEPVRPRLGLRDLPLIVGMGLTAMAGFNILMLYGLTMAPATDAAILSPGISPVVAAILSWRLLGERIGGRTVIGLVIALAGLFLVVNPQPGGPPNRLAGDLLFAAGSSMWGVYALIVKAATRRFAPSAATLYACVASTALLLPFSIGEQGASRLVAAPPAAWWGLLYLAVFPTALAFVFFYVGVRQVGTVRSTAFALLIPIVGVLSSATMLGERLTLQTIGGGVLVLAGLWMVQTRSAQNSPSRTS
jgi:drug/metabolite transporter (DMT)-like permease